MKFRTGLIIGGAVGYVLGAKAGRERYDQIVAAWARVSENPAIQDVTAKGKEVIDHGTAQARTVLSEGLDGASQKLRDTIDGAAA